MPRRTYPSFTLVMRSSGLHTVSNGPSRGYRNSVSQRYSPYPARPLRQQEEVDRLTLVRMTRIILLNICSRVPTVELISIRSALTTKVMLRCSMCRGRVLS